MSTKCGLLQYQRSAAPAVSQNTLKLAFGSGVLPGSFLRNSSAACQRMCLCTGAT